MTPEYKAEKEASVSYLSGGGIWEINYVTLAAPVRSTCSEVTTRIRTNLRRPLRFYGRYFRLDKASSNCIRFLRR